MFHIVLHQPEIPDNAGNVGRTCVALGAKLWLVVRWASGWTIATSAAPGSTIRGIAMVWRTVGAGRCGLSPTA